MYVKYSFSNCFLSYMVFGIEDNNNLLAIELDD